jgi:RimJ/RimL family protein N-acetyltransferase
MTAGGGWRPGVTRVADGERPERVTTARLVLRKVAPADVDTMIALHADPDAVRFRPEGVSSPEHSRLVFASWLDHWTEFGYGHWALDLAATGETVGFGGLQLAWAEHGPYLNVFYRLFPRAWGKGYAPEMVAAAVEWAQLVCPDLAITIITPTGNSAARRVAVKSGFAEVRRTHFQGTLSCFFELPG